MPQWRGNEEEIERGLCMTYIDDVFGYGRAQEKDRKGRLPS